MEDEQKSIEEYDEEVIWRCPTLGGEVTFRYCRKMTGGLPCSRVPGCWKTLFDVKKYLQEHYDLDELGEAWNQPRPDKLAHLADLISRSRRTHGNDEDS